jgi:hypothetical protein
MTLMIRLISNRCGVIALLAFCAKTCLAQAPVGHFEFAFDNILSPIINMTGTFQAQQSIIGVGGTETPILLGLGITNSMNGALRGSGTTLLQVGDNDFLAANFTANGRVSGGGINPIRVVLSAII